MAMSLSFLEITLLDLKKKKTKPKTCEQPAAKLQLSKQNV
jgi:hypothetical protein